MSQRKGAQKPHLEGTSVEMKQTGVSDCDRLKPVILYIEGEPQKGGISALASFFVCVPNQRLLPGPPAPKTSRPLKPLKKLGPGQAAAHETLHHKPGPEPRKAGFRCPVRNRHPKRTGRAATGVGVFVLFGRTPAFPAIEFRNRKALFFTHLRLAGRVPMSRN